MRKFIFKESNSTNTAKDNYRVGNQSSDLATKVMVLVTNLFMSLTGWHRNQWALGTSNVWLVNDDSKTRISIRELMPSTTRRWKDVAVKLGPVGVHWYLEQKNKQTNKQTTSFQCHSGPQGSCSCSVFTALSCGCFVVKLTFYFHQTPS